MVLACGGHTRPDSDLDILVDTLPRGAHPPFDLFKVIHLIEDATGLHALAMATERLLEIVCEASRRLPGEPKQGDSTIDWQRMIDFGNVLRHAYHAIRVDIVWDIVLNDLPALKFFAVRNIERR